MWLLTACRPTSDRDREGLRIPAGGWREMTVTKTKQINRLRALLLGGDDADWELSRGPLTDARLHATCATARSPWRHG